MPAWVDATVPEQRVVEAAALLPEYAGVTGWAALRWCGARWFDGTSDGGVSLAPLVVATLHNEIRSQGLVVASSERLPPGDLTVVDGIAVTTPLRAVTFEMRYAPSLRDAVRVLDMPCASDLVSLAEVADRLAELNGWTGVPLAREALGHGDENSWSPREVGFRMTWTVDADLPRPLVNRPVFDRAGRHVATPDLLDLETGLVGEYDGKLHLEGQRRVTDLQRESRMRDVGLEPIVVVSGESRGRTVQRLRAAYARALSRRGHERSWTIEPPDWWHPSWTVEQRRALRLSAQERYLPRAG